jgi:hypothetical protein
MGKPVSGESKVGGEPEPLGSDIIQIHAIGSKPDQGEQL